MQCADSVVVIYMYCQYGYGCLQTLLLIPSRLYLKFLIGINLFRMLPLIYMERYFSKSLIYVTLYQSIIVLKYQKENCLKFFSLLCNTSSSLCIFQCTLAARDSCSTNLKTTEQNNQWHSLGRSLFFSVTQVGESSSSMYSSVEVPEIQISLPAPGRGCLEQDA